MMNKKIKEFEKLKKERIEDEKLIYRDFSVLIILIIIIAIILNYFVEDYRLGKILTALISVLVIIIYFKFKK